MVVLNFPEALDGGGLLLEAINGQRGIVIEFSGLCRVSNIPYFLLPFEEKFCG